jgi:UDP-glucuronate 4-epimerase
MQKGRFLITGGAGFIGSHLVDCLLRNNPARIVVVDNFDDFYDPRIKRANITNHLKYPCYRLIEADIRQYSMLKQLLAEELFDVVIHLAAKAGVRPSVDDPHIYQDVNVAGTLNLLDLARRQGIKKFIFGSSSSVYGPAAEPPFREDAPLTPISPYAATKAAGEMFAHTYSHLYGIQIMCLRFFTVYGPRQRPDLAIHKFARLMINKRPIPVYGDGTSERDFTYIDDILQGVLGAIDYDETAFEVVNLGESQTITVNRMIELLEDALGEEAIIERHPMQPGDLPRTHADIEKANRLFGYRPTTPVEVGIRKFAEWLKKSREV